MITRKICQLLLVAIATSFIPSSNALYGKKSVEILELSVPEVAKAGDNVNLTCRFRLVGPKHRLYTVNWWRGKDQFYAYKENNLYPKNAYNFQGINVNVPASTQELVVLEKISEETTGDYKCEVMGESPAFKTAVKIKQMKVIVPPEKMEISYGLNHEANHQYQPGDVIQLNCTAFRVKPRPILIWKINNREVPQDHVQRFPDFENHRGRVTSTIGIRFRAPMFFMERDATVACVTLVEGQEFITYENLRLDPSAAFDQYSSCGWERTITWQILGLLLLAAYMWNL